MGYFHFVASNLMPSESLQTQHFLREARDCGTKTGGIANGVAATVLSTANTVTYLGSAVLRITFISSPEKLEEGFVNRVVQQISYAGCGVRDAFRSIAFVVFFSVPYLGNAIIMSIFYEAKDVTVFTYAIADQDWTKLPSTPGYDLTQANKDLADARADKQKAEADLAQAKKDHATTTANLKTANEAKDDLEIKNKDLLAQLAASAPFTTPEDTPTDTGKFLAQFCSDVFPLTLKEEADLTEDDKKKVAAFNAVFDPASTPAVLHSNEHKDVIDSKIDAAKVDAQAFTKVRDSLMNAADAKTEQAQLPGKLKELEKQIKDLTAERDTAQTEAGKIADLEQQIKDLTAERDTAQTEAGKIADLEQQIKDLTAERDTAQTETGKIADLEQQIKDLTAERDTAQTETGKVADLEQQIKDLTAERDTAQTEAGKVADLEQQIKDLTAERDTAQTEAGKVADLEQQIKDLTAERDTAQTEAGKVADLEQQIKDLTAERDTAQTETGKVADLEQQIKDLTAERDTAQTEAGKVADLEQQIKDLTAERDTAQTEAGKVADLEQQIKDLTAERDTAQTEAGKVADLEQQIKDLTAERDTAQTEAGKVADLEQQIKDLTAERDTAQTEAAKVVTLNRQIEELTAKVKKLERPNTPPPSGRPRPNAAVLRTPVVIDNTVARTATPRRDKNKKFEKPSARMTALAYTKLRNELEEGVKQMNDNIIQINRVKRTPDQEAELQLLKGALDDFRSLQKKDGSTISKDDLADQLSASELKGAKWFKVNLNIKDELANWQPSRQQLLGCLNALRDEFSDLEDALYADEEAAA